MLWLMVMFLFIIVGKLLGEYGLLWVMCIMVLFCMLLCVLMWMKCMLLCSIVLG